MPATNLQRIRELTEMLDISHITPSSQIGDAFHYEFGKSITYALCHTPEIAIAKCEIEAGTIVPEHTHKMLEILIVLEGELQLEMCHEEWELKPTQPLYILPNVPHNVTAIVDTVVLCMTIPSDKSFPHPIESG